MRKVKIRHIISMGIFLVLFTIPVNVFAVDFEITDVQIDVYLKEDGQAEVIEQHRYDFDSKFKGITREVFPKRDSSIVHFEAYENDRSLIVEKEESLYKIYRSGKNETIDFNLHYTIVDAVEKYEDGTQFYWTFFSERNESDYGDMTIVVHPPKKASEVDYLGYGAAYKTGALKEDGSVVFSFGAVEAGVGGDVRVVYESSLFPELLAMGDQIRHELTEDLQAIQEEEAAYLKTKIEMGTVGKFTIPGVLLALASVFSYMFRKRHTTKSLAQPLKDAQFVPTEKLSIPATIQYTMPFSQGPEMISASLLDLIRQGYVKQVTETSFELIDVTGTKDHEAALIDLLFRKVGDGTHFSFDDLNAYTKDKKNHQSYGKGLMNWRNGIIQESKDAELYDKKPGLRWLIGFVSVALIPIIIQFGRYELYAFMTILIVLAVIGLVTAIIYSPKNAKGFAIKEEWDELRDRMKNVRVDEWGNLPVDDKYRAYIYGIGVKDARLRDMYEQFERAESRTASQRDTHHMVYNPVFATQSFHTANTNASVSTDGSSSSGSTGAGGGGVGGRGGGSGAF